MVVDPDARRLRTDALRLRQILFNLLSNAAKFTQNGEVALRVRTAARGSSVGLLYEVTDTGAGMSSEQVARLFAPYVQVDEVLARRHGGTGLGLALTRRLCQLLGGEISVESGPRGPDRNGRASCARYRRGQGSVRPSG